MGHLEESCWKKHPELMPDNVKKTKSTQDNKGASKTPEKPGKGDTRGSPEELGLVAFQDELAT